MVFTVRFRAGSILRNLYQLLDATPVKQIGSWEDNSTALDATLTHILTTRCHDEGFYSIVTSLTTGREFSLDDFEKYAFQVSRRSQIKEPVPEGEYGVKIKFIESDDHGFPRILQTKMRYQPHNLLGADLRLTTPFLSQAHNNGSGPDLCYAILAMNSHATLLQAAVQELDPSFEGQYDIAMSNDSFFSP